MYVQLMLRKMLLAPTKESLLLEKMFDKCNECITIKNTSLLESFLN